MRSHIACIEALNVLVVSVHAAKLCIKFQFLSCVLPVHRCSLPQLRCVREALCLGSCLYLLLLGGLTCLVYSCSVASPACGAVRVGGLTHLRTQVFTTLATLAPFIHTPRLLKVSLPSVVVATLAPFIHTPRLLKVSLPSVVVVFFTCRSRGVFGKPCVREVVAFVYCCSVASPACGAVRSAASPTCGLRYSPHLPH